MSNPALPQHWPLVLQDFQKAYTASQESRMRHTPSLAILEILGIQRRELSHSSILRWLLDAGGSHEQGSLFMRVMLTALELDEGLAHSRYTVRTEVPARVDVSVISASRFAIFIENKVDHHEREMQFQDLQRALAATCYEQDIPGNCCRAVFLTDEGRDPESTQDPNFHPIRRIDLFELFLQRLRDQPILSEQLLDFLENYHRSIRGLHQ